MIWKYSTQIRTLDLKVHVKIVQIEHPFKQRSVWSNVYVKPLFIYAIDLYTTVYPRDKCQRMSAYRGIKILHTELCDTTLFPSNLRKFLGKN